MGIDASDRASHCQTCLNQQQQAKLEALQLLYSRDGLHKDGIKQGAVMCIAP